MDRRRDRHRFGGSNTQARVLSWEDFNAPVLRLLGDGFARPLHEIRREVVSLIGQPAGVRADPHEFDQQVGWSLFTLNRAGVVELVERDRYRITASGIALLSQNPHRIADSDLVELTASQSDHGQAAMPHSTVPLTETHTSGGSYDELDEAVRRMRRDVAEELVSRLSSQEPAKLYQVVCQLMSVLGLRVAGRSEAACSGVVDFVAQDLLRFERVCVRPVHCRQADVVEADVVEAFCAALVGEFDRGVMVTTGVFGQDAQQVVEASGIPISLIDGLRLGHLLTDHGLGGIRLVERRIVVPVLGEHSDSVWPAS